MEASWGKPPDWPKVFERSYVYAPHWQREDGCGSALVTEIIVKECDYPIWQGETVIKLRPGPISLKSLFLNQFGQDRERMSHEFEGGWGGELSMGTTNSKACSTCLSPILSTSYVCATEAIVGKSTTKSLIFVMTLTVALPLPHIPLFIGTFPNQTNLGESSWSFNTW